MHQSSKRIIHSNNYFLIYFCIQIAVFVLLNPVPEFIYRSRTSGPELLSASYNFIVENWVEWLTPNIVLAVIGYVLLREIELAGGYRVRIGSGVKASALRMVLDILERR